MPLLEVKGLTKTFGGLTAINHVDFTMEEHQIVSVIGPNGAGKTTFFNMISGYYPVDSGTITFNGHSLTKLTPEKVASFKIARTFQNIRLFQNMLVSENILMGCYMEMKANVGQILFRLPAMRSEEKSAFEKVLRLLEYVGLSGKEDEVARNLSYGQQRRLEIARALAMEPKLLMLDEPAAGLNPKETEEMKNFILRLRDDLHTTVLLIEHDMKLVMGLSDKITVLNYGEKIADGTPEEIRNNDKVIKAYLGVEDHEEDDLTGEVAQ